MLTKEPKEIPTKSSSNVGEETAGGKAQIGAFVELNTGINVVEEPAQTGFTKEMAETVTPVKGSSL